MIFIPFWIFFDFIFKKNSFYNFYITFENKLRKPKNYIPLIFLILLNWIWNIKKNL